MSPHSYNAGGQIFWIIGTGRQTMPGFFYYSLLANAEFTVVIWLISDRIRPVRLSIVL
jgi:hypothetical protein